MAVSYQFLIDWNDDGDNADTYEDVSAHVLSAEWFLGDGDPYGHLAPPGWAKIELNNSHQRFTPLQSAADIRAGKVLVIKSNDGTTTRTHWTGFIWSLELPGGYLSPQRCHIYALTWDAVLTQETVILPIQLDKRANQVIDTLLTPLHPRYAVLDGFLVIGIDGRNIIGTHKLFGTPAMTWDEGAAGVGRLTFPYLGDTYAAGIKASDVMQDLLTAEIGKWYVNRAGAGVFLQRFWMLSDLTSDATITTGIEPTYGQGQHIINAVQLDIFPREIGAAGTVLWELAGYQRLDPANEITLTARFRDAQKRRAGALSVTTPEYGTDYTLNTQANGLGDTVPTEAVRVRVDATTGGSAAKIIFTNTVTYSVYIHDIQIRGQIIEFPDPVRVESIDYWSRTRYGSRLLLLSNGALQDFETAKYWGDYQRVRRNIAARLLRVTLSTVENQTPVLARTVADRVTIEDDALDITEDYFISAEHHRLVKPGVHQVTWTLIYADDYTFFIVGVHDVGSDRVLA